MSAPLNTVLSNRPPPPAPLSIAQINEHLEYANERLQRRAAVLIEALQKIVDTIPKIEDDEQLAPIATTMKSVNTLIEDAEDERKKSKHPFLEGGRAVDGWFTKLLGDVTIAVGIIQGRANVYQAAKLAAERAVREAAAKAAQEAANKAAAEAAAAMKANAPSADRALDRAEEAAQAAETAQQAATAAPAEMTTVRSDEGARAGVRRTWSFEVDIVELVKAVVVGKASIMFLTHNPETIKLLARDRDPLTRKPLLNVPGITWVEKIDTSWG